MGGSIPLGAKFAKGLFALKVLGRRIPLSVNLVVTSACTFACTYCHTKLYGDREMDTPTIRRLIEEFVRQGMVFLAITGGEPLLRQDIGEIVDYAHSRGVSTRLTTNGMLVPERIASLRNLDALLVSLDGPQMHNDAIRGRGSYQKALRALRKARDAGLRTFISVVITRQTPEDIDHSISVARRCGTAIVFQPAYPLFPGLSIQEAERLDAYGSAARATWDRIIRLKRHGAPVANSRAYLRYVRDSKKMTKKNGGFGCWAGKAFCCVYPDGRVNPCGSLPGQWLDGKSLGFAEAFSRLPEVSCTNCSCVSFVELNMACSRFAPEILLNARRWYLKRGTGG